MGCLRDNQFWITVAIVGSMCLAISLGLGIQFGIYKLRNSEPITVYEPVSSLGAFNTRYERARPPVDRGLIHDDLFLTGSVALVVGLGIASLTLAIRSGNAPGKASPDGTSDAEEGVTNTQGIDVSFWAGQSTGSVEDITETGDKAPWLYDPAFRSVCLVILSTGSLLTITFGLFGMGWDYDKLHTRVPYVAFEKQLVEVDLEIKMGIYGYNITMDCPDCFEPAGSSCDRSIPYKSCGIYYNYGFEYGYYFQHRSGFGKFSNTLNLQWREAIAEGMPTPIVEIASAFIVDGEKIRWQRRIIKCAYGTGVCMWWAATMWIMANITGIMWVQSSLNAEKVGVSSVLDEVVYKRSESIWSAFASSIIGIASGLLLACIVWESVRPGNFPGAAFEDGVLEPQRGWTWNMCLSVGILHLVAGFTLLYYSTIQATLSKFKSSDDDEINTYVQSSLEISEINKTDTKTM